jgi:hypothetical protein
MAQFQVNRPRDAAMRQRLRRFFTLGFFGIAILVVALIVTNVGTNPYTPPGHEGYVFHQPLVFGQRGFLEAQRGPTSTGWRWRAYVTNIDMRVTTFTENLQIFSSDNLEVSFEAHARIRLRRGSVRQVVERYSGEDWYANNVRRPYLTAVREEVRQHEAFTIKDRSVGISRAVLRRLRNEYREMPFEFVSLTIGNIAYPESVTTRVVANLAAEQRRQRREVERQIAESNAQILEVRARGSAEAQQIEQQTLTPLFVQHEAAELYRALADEENDDDGVARAGVVVVIPTRSDRAGVPRIYTGGE